jgi:hypothetical protein
VLLLLFHQYDFVYYLFTSLFPVPALRRAMKVIRFQLSDNLPLDNEMLRVKLDPLPPS